MPTINLNVILAAIGYAALTGIFNLALGHKSQVEAWATANPKLAAILKFTRALGLDPWNLFSAALLVLKGKLPAAQQANSPIAKAEQKKADVARLAGPLLVLLFCCSLPALHGCGTHVNWPRVLQCSDVLEQPLLDEVGKVLAGTGDVQADLETLVPKYAPGIVECAVQQIVGDLMGDGKMGTARAAMRGKMFLRKVQQQ